MVVIEFILVWYSLLLPDTVGVTLNTNAGRGTLDVSVNVGTQDKSVVILNLFRLELMAAELTVQAIAGFGQVLNVVSHERTEQ